MSVVDAALLGYFDQVKELLEKDGSLVDSADIYGDTALHAAASKGHANIVRYLLDKGANVNATNSIGSTPLHKAATTDHLAVCRLLTSNGADVNKRNSSGRLPEELTPSSRIRNHLLEVAKEKQDSQQNRDEDPAITLKNAVICEKIDVPKRFHCHVVGREGRRLRELRETTGAEVDIPKPNDSSSAITVRGRTEAVRNAVKQLELIISELNEKSALPGAGKGTWIGSVSNVTNVSTDTQGTNEVNEDSQRETVTAMCSIPRDKHRLIVGAKGRTIKELCETFSVRIRVPDINDSTEDRIHVHGRPDAVHSAIEAIMKITSRPSTNNFKDGDSPVNAGNRSNTRNNKPAEAAKQQQVNKGNSTGNANQTKRTDQNSAQKKNKNT